MDIKTAFEKAKEKGVKETFQYCVKRTKQIRVTPKNKFYRVLLLTNRDSDNVGDQVIEACDISLIETIMKNLDIKKENYEIVSRAASMISQAYIKKRDPKLLKTAEFLIKDSDIVIFGGAPMFNYLYQVFYERTAVTLELAKKYNKPVIFSAIGIESYDEANAKCQRLKETLNFDCVKQITTRDDFDALQKFKENENMIIKKVSDPAVFCSKVFENHLVPKKGRKKVGIFVLRANGFKDNKINFSRTDAAKLWKELARELKNKGYDYELLTSGHFGDEAYLDWLIRKHGFNEKNCVFNINSPEQLIGKISSYDAVVSCRLHPSIISYSLDVPSVGVVWNTKVNGFYNSIGCEDRVVDINGITAEKVVDKIEQAIAQGVNKDEEYLISVYNTLFNGIKNAVCPEKTSVMPYTYQELLQNFSVYEGTSAPEQIEKLKRKFRRTYGKYNELFEANIQNKAKIKELTAELEKLKG